MRQQLARRDNRYAARLDVKLEATLRELGSSQKFDIDVTDMSLTGFRFSTSFRLNVGQTVSVTIPGLAALEARVCWVEHFNYGAAFDRALHIAVFDHLVARHRSDR